MVWYCYFFNAVNPDYYGIPFDPSLADLSKPEEGTTIVPLPDAVECFFTVVGYSGSPSRYTVRSPLRGTSSGELRLYSVRIPGALRGARLRLGVFQSRFRRRPRRSAGGCLRPRGQRSRRCCPGTRLQSLSAWRGVQRLKSLCHD